VLALSVDNRPQPRTPDADAWSAAQARFVQEPRAGCVPAQASVREVFDGRGLGTLERDVLARRWRTACETIANERSSTTSFAQRSLCALFETRSDAAAPPHEG
jgi:hypothetical protein